MRLLRAISLAGLLATPACDAGRKAGSCPELLAAVEAELAALPSPCTKDAECTCYPGGTDRTGCGGVSGVEAAKRIAGKANAVLSAGCSATLSCAPSVCQAACVEGRCRTR